MILQRIVWLPSRQLSTQASALRIRAKAKLAEIDAKSPIAPSLIDSFGRPHGYLRISLTERCNLRCFYCMPSDGVELSPHGKLLTNEEVLRLATLFVKSGVTKIRLTGGEPTVRKGISDIIRELNNLRTYGLQSIAMTSNGLALHRRLPELVENGLTHLNLSLDTMDPFKFELITRRPGHDAVLKTLDAALSSKALSVKLNMVVIKGLNDSEIFDFVELTKNRDLSVRFIEFMPFNGNRWDVQKMVPSSELLNRLKAQHPDIIRASDSLNDTARTWTIPGYQGSFGFISSMSDHFCSTCNRLRITADGQIKVCLFDPKEISLRDEMRNGASDEELLEHIGRAVRAKHEKHAGMEDIDVVNNRPMILIGGYSDSQRLRYTQSQRHRRHPVFLTNSFASRSPIYQHHFRYYATSTNSAPEPSLTHVNSEGQANMVDISEKQPTKRSATAVGRIYIPRRAFELITSSPFPSTAAKTADGKEELEAKVRRKGDTLAVAQLAAIMGAKKTSDLIPLCHPLSLTNVAVDVTPEGPTAQPNGTEEDSCSILISATASCVGKTGVEMEALTAVSIGLLTVWDMLKAVAGKEMKIGNIYVSRKSGGRSGDFER